MSLDISHLSLRPSKAVCYKWVNRQISSNTLTKWFLCWTYYIKCLHHLDTLSSKTPVSGGLVERWLLGVPDLTNKSIEMPFLLLRSLWGPCGLRVNKNTSWSDDGVFNTSMEFLPNSPSCSFLEFRQIIPLRENKKKLQLKSNFMKKNLSIKKTENFEQMKLELPNLDFN